ncbi:MAG TPA: hypothetical protein VI011_07300 [Asanoa sp.]
MTERSEVIVGLGPARRAAFSLPDRATTLGVRTPADRGEEAS